jgi:hypothetical protein
MQKIPNIYICRFMRREALKYTSQRRDRDLLPIRRLEPISYRGKKCLKLKIKKEREEA